MNKLKLFLLILMGISADTIAKGVKLIEKPIQLNVTINTPQKSFYRFDYLPAAQSYLHKNEAIVLEDKQSLNLKKQLPGVSQILNFDGISVFVGAGQNVNLSISFSKNKSVLPNRRGRIAKFQGIDGFKQSLPYLMDSLYYVSTERLAVMDYVALKNYLMNLGQQSAILFKRAKVVKTDDLDILKCYTGMLRMQIKSAYLTAHQDKKDLPAEFIKWYFQGETLSVANLNKICNAQLVNEYVYAFAIGNEFGGPARAYVQRWDDILKEKNQFLIKTRILDFYMAKFKYKGLTEEIKEFYPRLKSAISIPSDAQRLAQFYGIYEKMEPGNPAPDFALPDVNEKMVKLSDFRGKMLVIDFWGTWCGPCKETLPFFLDARKKYKDSTDIVFVTAALESPDAIDWRAYLKDHDMEDGINLLIRNTPDNKTNEMLRTVYQLNTYPRYMVIDRQGNFLQSYLEHPTLAAFNEKIAQWYKEKR